MAKTKAVKVGDEVEAYCGTCKAETVHVVEVIKNDKISRVLCKSCSKSHLYRKAKDVKAKTTKKKTRKASTKTKEQRKWSRLMSKVDEETAVDYAMNETFNANDVINHNTFGLGVVVEVVDPSKMKVAFEEGMKTLVQNR